MHRYDELEKLYYKKIFLKYGTVIAIIFLFVAGFFILKHTQKSKEIIDKSVVKSKEISQKTKKEPKKEVKKEVKKEIKPQTPKQIKTEEKEKLNTTQTSKAAKSFHFILPDISGINSNDKNEDIALNNQKNSNIISKKIKEVEINHTANIGNFKIIEKKASLRYLIKKFNQTKNFDLAILISKEYLKKNSLKEAQIWALKANNINPNSYKSWLLFANILQKEKKYKKAKEILKVYINSYGQNDIIEEKLRSLNDK